MGDIQEELMAKLKHIVQPYVNNHGAFDKLDIQTEFVKDLDINSANLVDIILDVEDEFDIRIENEDMEKMLSVGASLDIIKSKIE